MMFLRQHLELIGQDVVPFRIETVGLDLIGRGFVRAVVGLRCSIACGKTTVG